MVAITARQNYWLLAVGIRWNLQWNLVSAMWPFHPYQRGVYSYPVQQAAEIAVQTVRSAVQEHPRAFDEILWVLFDERTKLVYDGELQEQI